MRSEEDKERMQKWLEKALHKIDTMPREELLASLEQYGLVAPKMQIR